ncbi:hypothetical protein DFQ29_008993 [Apophysomyces sp. BC1021]|nr:hypothetical protein DFQ29_008993 [Apophysomyces sp. BC1021]
MDVVTAAKELPVSEENLKRAKSWLWKYGIEVMTEVVDNTSREATLAKEVCRVYTSLSYTTVPKNKYA